MGTRVGVVGGLALLLASTISSAHEGVFGGLILGDDCSPNERDYLESVMEKARDAARSQAFVDCVNEAVTNPHGTRNAAGKPIGPYLKCQGDPFFDESPVQQAQRAIEIMRSPNDVSMNCTGGGGNASAPLGHYGHTDPEHLNWGAWLEQEQPDRDATAAGILMHEISHTHGYTHGGNSPASAASACGYWGVAGWNYQVNTMPYILGLCITAAAENQNSFL
jgi:hypothetical protein